jgi:TrbC/VIRB2 pilin
MEYSSSLVSSPQWIQALLTGSAATIIAVIAVSSLGIMMFFGRVSSRRGLFVILGCFIVFSSSFIARGLMLGVDTTATEPPELIQIPSYSPTKPEVLYKAPFNPFDPYSGAANPQRTPEELPSIH